MVVVRRFRSKRRRRRKTFRLSWSSGRGAAVEINSRLCVSKCWKRKEKSFFFFSFFSPLFLCRTEWADRCASSSYIPPPCQLERERFSLIGFYHLSLSPLQSRLLLFFHLISSILLFILEMLLPCPSHALTKFKSECPSVVDLFVLPSRSSRLYPPIYNKRWFTLTATR